MATHGGFERGAREARAEAGRALARGRPELAVPALERGAEAARRRLQDADTSAFGWYAYFALTACRIHLQAGSRDRLIDASEELWRLSRLHGSATGRLHGSMFLLWAHADAGNVATAVQHALAIPGLLAQTGTEPEPGHEPPVPPVDPDGARQLLEAFAQRVYYEEEDYRACAEVCRSSLAIIPAGAGLTALLAFSLTHLEENEEAVAAFRVAIAHDPDRAGLYTGLTRVLAELGRVPEALEAQSTAIAMAPHESTYRLTRGQLYQALGDHCAALDEFDHVLESLGGGPGKSTAPGAAPADGSAVAQQPATRARYRRDPPAQDIVDFAGVSRLRSLAELGRLDTLTTDAGSMLLTADRPTRQAVLLVMGDALRRAGRTEEAWEAYRGAVAAGDLRAETRVAACEMLLESGRIDEAVGELDQLTDLAAPNSDPVLARKILTTVVDRFPHHRGARRALGHAECDTGSPARAVATLTGILDEDPDDAWALLWRGIARVSRSDESEAGEEGWNRGSSLIRVRDALLDLAAAARVDGDHRERARQTFGWLLERAMWSPVLRDALLADSDAVEELIPVLPGLSTPFAELRESHTRHNPARRWEAAASGLARAGEGLRELGLPVLAALADALRADTLIRLDRLQDALDLLAEAEAVIPLLALSPYQGGDERMETAVREARSRGGKALLLPLEYLFFAAHVVAEIHALLHRLRADAMAMLGNVHGALEQAENPLARGSVPEGDRMVLQRAALLRDAGRHDDALALLDSLADETLSVGGRAWRENTRITVLMNSGRLAEARTRALEVLDALPEELTYERTVTSMNLSWIHVLEDRPAEALALLDEYGFPADAPLRRRQSWHGLRARALAAMGDHARALADFRTALSLAEEFRRTLRSVEARISWQAEQQADYEAAMLAALLAEDTGTLFELLEQSKTQAFLDQLEPGSRTAKDGGAVDELRTFLATARARRSVARQLARATDPAAEFELLRTYTERGGRPRRSGDGTMEVSGDEPVTRESAVRLLEDEEAAVRRLEDLYEGAIAADHEITTDRAMPAGEVARRMRLVGGDSALLVEYLVTDRRVMLLLLRPGDGVPAVETVETGARELTELVALLRPGQAGTDSGFPDPDVLERLAPLVEPILRHSRPGDVVWLVPHAVLHHVPLHAVPVNGVPLGRTHPVCYTQSAAVLRRCQEMRDRQREKGPHGGPRARWRHPLVLGDSRSDLPHSRFEAGMVAGAFGVDALLGGEATLSALREGLSRTPAPDLLHLACHGQFDDDRPLGSGIMLAPRAGQPDDDAVLTAEEIMGFSLNTDLVVLSACGSGRSEQRPGDELIGLARALLQAGAPAVLVSMWPVDDLSTLLLMEGFYRRAAQQEPGTTLAAALREAQTAVADLTAAAVVAYCDLRLADADGAERLLLLLDRADARIMAGDLAAATRAYRELAAEAQRSRSPQARDIATAVARKLPLLELRAERPPRVDYTARPFADPYHWASFILIGDWR